MGETGAAEAMLDVQGLRIAIRGDWVEVVNALRLDFTWFATEQDDRLADIRLTVEQQAPDYLAFGRIPAAYVTERNVSFRGDGVSVVDYLGEALLVADDDGSTRVTGESATVVRKAAFDFLLSRIGAHLDRRGLPRLHGLGLVGDQGGVVVMIPSGGGKTTLALRALADDDVRFLSEGSPLLDRRGRLHAFPLPLWVRTNSTEVDGLPDEGLRRMNGELTDPRLLEVAAFRDRIATQPVPLRHIVLGRRSLGAGSQLDELPRRAAVSTLLRDSIVGFGFFQGFEFLLRSRLRDLVGRAGPMTQRGVCCAAGLAHARVWRLTMGHDKDSNWPALERVLR